MSKYIAISDARANLPELVENVNTNNNEVFITVYGKPVAKLVSAESEKENKTIDFEKVIDRYLGIWDDKEGETIAKYASQMRKKGKIIGSK
jgi:prevent-host-death family protein